jgi:hypothetical protein
VPFWHDRMLYGAPPTSITDLINSDIFIRWRRPNEFVRKDASPPGAGLKAHINSSG